MWHTISSNSGKLDAWGPTMVPNSGLRCSWLGCQTYPRQCNLLGQFVARWDGKRRSATWWPPPAGRIWQEDWIEHLDTEACLIGSGILSTMVPMSGSGDGLLGCGHTDSDMRELKIRENEIDINFRLHSVSSATWNYVLTVIDECLRLLWKA